MMCYDDELIVNGEDFYDAAANNYDTTLVVRDSSNLGGTIDGWFEMSGRAHAAGYMGRIPIPASLQQLFGGAQYYTGWSSVYSITSRYSQGPSLWTFDPYSSFSGKTEGPVSTTDWMNFPYSGGSSSWLSPTAPYYSPQFSCNNPAIPDHVFALNSTLTTLMYVLSVMPILPLRVTQPALSLQQIQFGMP